MQKPLSFKQKEFLDFVQGHSLQYGQAPSYLEIMAALGFSSLGTVNWYVQTLGAGGYLERIKGPNGKRALAVKGGPPTPARLPLVGVVAAGYPVEALENADSVDVPPPFVHPDNFVLRVRGDSMVGENIEDGDYIIVRRTSSAAPGQLVVALLNGEVTLKRYYPLPGAIELRPRNPDYPVLRVREGDDFQINGLVLFSFREY